MATYYWRSSVNNTWTSNNWSTTDGGPLSGTYPQAGDTAIFKASSGQGNCGLDTNVSITKLDMRSDYTGTLSGNTYNFTTTGDMIIAGTQIIAGSGTWTTAGHLNYVNVGTFTPNASKFIMTGTGKTLTNSAANRYFYDLEINGTISAVGAVLWHNSLTIKTNKSLTLTDTDAGNYNLGGTCISKLYLESGADFDLGGHQINWFTPGTGGVQSMASTARIRNGSIRCLYPSTTTGVGVWDFGATYGWEINFRVFGPPGNDGHFTFPNKVCKIGGYFRAEIRSWYPNGSLTLHAAGSSTDVQISGYFATLSDTVNIGSVNVDNTGVTGNKWTFNSHVYDWMETANGASRGWTKNAESCYASSAVARDWDFTNWTVQTIQIYASSGTVTMNSDVNCVNFDVSQGTFDANDYDLYVQGNFFVRTNATWTLSSSTIINLTGSAASQIEAVPRVDPITLNRTGAGGMTQSGNVHTSNLVLTDGFWAGVSYDLETHAGLSKGASAGPIDLGTGDITGWGDIDITSMDATGCQIIFAASKTLTYTNWQYLDRLQIINSSTCSLMAGTDIVINITGSVDLQANSTFDTKDQRVYCWTDARVWIRTNALWTGTRQQSLLFYNTTSGNGLVLNDGIYAGYELRFYQCTAGTRWAPGVYNQITTYIYGGNDCYIKPDAGTFYLANHLRLYNTSGNTVYIDMTNNPTFQIGGDCLYGGGITSADIFWTINDETFEFVGSANQEYEWAHEIGNVVVDNSGTGSDLFLNLGYGAHLHCKNLTGTDGGINCNSHQVTVEGDCVLDFDNLTTGGADWNLYGHFDWKDVTTWSVDSSQKFIMNGVDKYLLGANTKDLPDLTIPVGKSAYIHASTLESVAVSNAAVVAGTLTVDLPVDFQLDSANLTVETTGTVTGSSDIIFYLAGSSTGLILNGSYTYSPARTYFVDPDTTSLIPAGTYDGHVRVHSTSGVKTWQPDTGTYDISGYLLFEAEEGDTLNVDCRSSQPVFNIGSLLYLQSGATSGGLNVYCNHPTLDIDWTINGTSSYHFATNNWFKGSGTITFDGGDTREIDFYDNEVENIVINKTSGTDITLAYELKCDSLTINSGDFDASTYDVTVGDLTLTGTGAIDWGDNTWEISGNISTTGQSGTWIGGGTTWNLSGSGKTWTQRDNMVIANTWIKSGASYNCSGIIIPVYGSGSTFIIDGTITGIASFRCYYGEIHLNSTGVFQANFIRSYLAQDGGGFTTWDGDYDSLSGLLYLREWHTAGVMVPADYSAHNLEVRIESRLHNGDMVFSSGTYTFHHLTCQAIYAGYTTAINTTNNPDIIIKGNLNSDVTLGTLTWTKGTGTITMDSTGDYIIGMGGLELENMVIDKNSSITLTADLDVTSLEISSGDFDAAGYNVTISSDALDISTSGTVDCGSGDWTCWGDVIIDGIGTYNVDTANFYLKGTSKGIATATDYWGFENLYVTGSYTANGLGGADNVYVAGILDITGTFITGNTNTGGLTLAVNTDLRIQTGGTLTGGGATTGEIRWYFPEVGITVLDGTWSNWITQIYYPNTAANWVPGTYDCRIEWITSPDVACVVNFDAGTYNFTGGLIQFRVGISGNIHDEDLTVNLNAGTVFNTSNDTAFGFAMTESTSTGDLYFNCNNANFNFSGNVFLNDSSPGSDVIYTKGTGTITFEGDVNQFVNMPYSLEDIVVNKSANTVDFVSAITCETYTLTSGGADFNDDAATGVVSITGGTQSMTGTNKTWTCPSFTVNAGVSATVDVNDNNVTITGTGDLSFLANCNISFGSRTWTCNGDFFATGDTVVFTRDTSTLRLTGTGNFTCTGSLSTKYLYSIEIPVSAVRTVLAGSSMCSYNTVGTDASIDVDGTLTLNGSGRAFYHSKINLNTGGIINGSSFLQCYASDNGGGLTTLDGTLTPGTFYLDYPTATAICVSGTYDCTVYVQCNDSSNSVWQLSAGTYIYNYSVYYQATDAAGSLTINGSVNNPDHVYKQHVFWTNTGDVFWTAGTGTITFDDIGDYEIDFGNELIEDVHIEKDSSGKITLRNDNFSAGSLTITTGEFDANDHDVTLTGDFYQADLTKCYAGTGTWAISGGFDNSSITAGNNYWLAEGGEVKLVGTGNLKSEGWNWQNEFHKLTIEGNYTIPATSNMVSAYDGADGWLKIVNGASLVVDNSAGAWVRGDNNLIVENGGTLTITSIFYVFRPGIGYGVTNDGIINGTGRFRFYEYKAGAIATSGNYSVRYLQIYYGSKFDMGAGTWITDNIYFGAANENLIIDMNSNDPIINTSGSVIFRNFSNHQLTINRSGTANDWTIEEDFTRNDTGSFVYTKGDANLCFEGGGTQVYDCNGFDVEDIIIEKSGGTMTLESELTCDSLTFLEGELDFNGQTVQTTGDFTINAANGTDATIVSDADAMNTANITVGNDFYVSNITFNATNTWYLDVQGVNAHAYDVSVRYSDANAGTTIDATAPGNTDLGVNYNWDFGQLPGEAVSSIHSLSFHCFPWTRHTNRHVRGNRRI